MLPAVATQQARSIAEDVTLSHDERLRRLIDLERRQRQEIGSDDVQNISGYKEFVQRLKDASATISDSPELSGMISAVSEMETYGGSGQDPQKSSSDSRRQHA